MLSRWCMNAGLSFTLPVSVTPLLPNNRRHLPALSCPSRYLGTYGSFLVYISQAGGWAQATNQYRPLGLIPSSASFPLSSFVTISHFSHLPHFASLTSICFPSFITGCLSGSRSGKHLLCILLAGRFAGKFSCHPRRDTFLIFGDRPYTPPSSSFRAASLTSSLFRSRPLPGSESLDYCWL